MEKIKELANKTKDVVLMQAQNAKEHVNRDEYQKDPLVEEAKEKLEKLERAINRCETDMKDLSTYIAKLSVTSLQFTEHFRKSDRTLGRTENPKVVALDDFARLLSNKLKEPQVMHYKQKIESQFKEINDVLNQLKVLKNKRHDVRLLTASLKNRVENHSKKGDPAEVAELRIRYENNNAELDIITKKFIKGVNNFWTNRHLIFEPIMEEISKLTFNLCKDLYEPTHFMMMSLPPELLTTDFLKTDQEN